MEIFNGTYEIEARALVKAGLDYLFEKGIKENLLRSFEVDARSTHAFVSIEESNVNNHIFDDMLNVVREHSTPDSHEQLLAGLRELSDAATATAEKIGQRMGVAMFRMANLSEDVIGQYAKEDHFRTEVDRVHDLLNLAANWKKGMGFESFVTAANRVRRRMMYDPEAAFFEASFCVLRYAYVLLQEVLIQTAYERLKARIIFAADYAGRFPYVRRGECLKTMGLSSKYISGHYHDLTGFMHTLDNDTEDGPVAILFEHHEMKRWQTSELLIALCDLYEFAKKQEKALACMVSGYLLNDIDTAYFTTALRDHLVKVSVVKSVTLGAVQKAEKHVVSRMSVTLASDALIDVDIISEYGSAEIILHRKSPEEFSSAQEKELDQLLTDLLFYTDRKKCFKKVKMA